MSPKWTKRREASMSNQKLLVMKTQIESRIRWSSNFEVMNEFNEILDYCLLATGEDQLRKWMQDHYRHFTFGFGSHHMWVKQCLIDDSSKTYPGNLLFVEF